MQIKWWKQQNNFLARSKKLLFSLFSRFIVLNFYCNSKCTFAYLQTKANWANLNCYQFYRGQQKGWTSSNFIWIAFYRLKSKLQIRVYQPNAYTYIHSTYLYWRPCLYQGKYYYKQFPTQVWIFFQEFFANMD